MTSAVTDSISVPTAVSLMPTRYAELQAALDGYAQGLPPLVAATQTDSGTVYRALGMTDDAGLYYMLPKFAHLFHLALPEAWAAWFFAILILSFGLGIYGMTRLLNTMPAKILYFIELFFLGILIIKRGDIYQLAPCLALAAVPLLLRHMTSEHEDHAFWRYSVALGLAGFIFGCTHLVRSHSATGLMLFVIILLLFGTAVRAWHKRLLLVAIVLIGFMLPLLYMNHVADMRDAFLKAHQPNYHPVLRQHPFWHTVYIGLGYLSNDYGLAYKDIVAAKKAHELAPDVLLDSPQYEAVLKTAVIELLRKAPVFVAETLAAKFGVVLIYFLLAANLGILAAIRYPKPWSVEVAFGVAIAFNALFGLLAVPRLAYLEGFIAFAMLYGVISLDTALHQSAVLVGHRKTSP
jgi:hypothetical protein